MRVPCLLALILASTSSCGADPPLQTETDVVISVSDAGRDYRQYSTYVLPDEVFELCVQSGNANTNPLEPSSPTSQCLEIDHTADASLLRAIERNLDALGYERVTWSGDAGDENSPDLILIAGIVAKNVWDLSESFCLESESFEGCLAPTTSKTLLLPSGSLVISMIDRAASSNDRYTTVWSAAVDRRWASGSGLGAVAMGGSGGTDILLSPWILGIDEAFGQSSGLGSHAQ